MNTEDSEFERIEREQKMRAVPDAIHHTDLGETLEYIQGWNDCRAAMLEQPAPAAQQEPEWYHFIRYGDDCFVPYKGQAPEQATPLYTTPQAQRKPLTDEEIMAIGKELGLKCRFGGNPNIDFDYARAIEAAHGITKGNT